MKTLKPQDNDDRLVSLNELRSAIDVYMDIRLKINGTEWYIGAPQGPRIIASDDFSYQFKTNDPDEVLDYVINGKKIRDQWRDIEVIAM